MLPNVPDFHVSVGGIVHGPFDELRARTVAAEHVAAGRDPTVWRPSWNSWVPAAQVWPVQAAPAFSPPSRNKLSQRAVRAIIGTSVILTFLIALHFLDQQHRMDPQPTSLASLSSRTPCQEFARCACEVHGRDHPECDAAQSAAHAESVGAGYRMCAGATGYLRAERKSVPSSCTSPQILTSALEGDLALAASARPLDRDPESFALLIEPTVHVEKVFPELAEKIRNAPDEFAREELQKQVPAYEQERDKILRELSAGAWFVKLQVDYSSDYSFDEKAYWMTVHEMPPVALALRSPRMRRLAFKEELAWPVEKEPARALKAELAKFKSAEFAFTIVPVLGSVRPVAYRFCTKETPTTCSEWVPWLPQSNPSCPTGGCLEAIAPNP